MIKNITTINATWSQWTWYPRRQLLWGLNIHYLPAPNLNSVAILANYMPLNYRQINKKNKNETRPQVSGLIVCVDKSVWYLIALCWWFCQTSGTVGSGEYFTGCKLVGDKAGNIMCANVSFCIMFFSSRYSLFIHCFRFLTVYTLSTV